MILKRNRQSSVEPKVRLLLALRLAPGLLGFIFSLYYSKLMGLENRSFLTFVLLLNALFSYLLLTGLGMRLRRSSLQEIRLMVPSYIIVSFLISLLILILMICILILGAKYLILLENTPLPRNILIAIALYSFLSALSVPFLDLLSTLQSMKAFLMIETVIVLIQIFIFTLLVSIGQITFFVSALLAYALSYSFMAFSTLVLVISTGHFTSNLKASFQTLLQFSLLKESIRGVLVILIERIDKLLVPFFYISPQLAQISIFSGVLNFFRVLPDTSIRLTQKRAINNQVPLKSSGLSGWLQTVVIICVVVLVANFIIYFILGEEWVLSLPIILILTLYEVLVWRAKLFLLDSEFISDKVSETLNSGLILFYLLPLPFLMMKFSYAFVLSVLVTVLLLWLAFSTKKQKLDKI